MKLAACLCWYDEPAERLDRCIRSLAHVADLLIAADGQWKPYPPDAPASTPAADQVEAIAHAAAAANLELHLIAPPATLPWPWPSQTAKRAAALERAAAHADWILVIDADEAIAHANPQQFRHTLTTTPHDAAQITIVNITGHDHRDQPRPWRRLFRATPDLTVRDWHNGYRNHRGNLAGDQPLQPAHDCTRLLTIEHAPRSRSPERNAAAKRYRHLRAAAGER